MEIILPETKQKINYQIHEANKPEVILILAHGSGAGMNHPFMQDIALLLQELNITVVLFNFPYMEEGKKAPGAAKKNIFVWKVVTEAIAKQYSGNRIYIGGKSYGGRIASHLFAEQKPSAIKGIIYLGFPLHAPGKDGTDRAAHLTDITVPQLFLQGTKDKLARKDLIKKVTNSLPNSSLKFFKDADHSFHVPKRAGKTDSEILLELARACREWILQQQ